MNGKTLIASRIINMSDEGIRLVYKDLHTVLELGAEQALANGDHLGHEMLLKRRQEMDDAADKAIEFKNEFFRRAQADGLSRNFSGPGTPPPSALPLDPLTPLD